MPNDNRRFKTDTNRRAFLKATGGIAAAGTLAGCLGSQGSENDQNTSKSGDKKQTDFPTKPITFIIPYGPGGGYDFYTRLLVQVLNQKDIIPVQAKAKNVAGSGGMVATNQVYNAEPTGYTNMIINTESFAIAQLARPEAARYQLQKMTALPRVAGTIRTIGVSTATDITTAEEFNQALKNGEINIGNMGPTTTDAVMLKVLAVLGGEATFSLKDYNQNAVTFDSRGGMFTALKRGSIDAMAGSFASLYKYVKSGDLRYVWVYTKKEHCPKGTKNSKCDTFATFNGEIPNVDQIIALSGGPYHRIFTGPPGIPENRHTYLCEKITKAIKNPLFQQQAKKANRPIKYGDCQLADKAIEQTVQTYKDNKNLLKKLDLI